MFSRSSEIADGPALVEWYWNSVPRDPLIKTVSVTFDAAHVVALPEQTD